MELIRNNDQTTKYLKDFINEPFVYLDVGCSGGVDPGWQSFGEKIQTFGFDPVIEEIERLNKQNKNLNTKFIEGFVVGSGKYKPPIVEFSNRLSSNATEAILKEKKRKFSFKNILERNHWKKLNLSKNKIFLPDYLRDNRIDPHFVKIDVDGPDFDILVSLEKFLKKDSFLGVCIEVNYNGSADDDVNTFHNVDRFLRRCDFQLFDFTKRKYSISALPTPYAITIPAQSNYGRPFQGDALYFKDYIALEEFHQYKISAESIIKLAATMSLFDHKDSCAELLIRYENLFPKNFDLDFCLENLVKELGIDVYEGLSYKKIISLFNKDSKIFYP